MGYCIDDLCHGGSPLCGAAGPYHCRAANSGPSVDHQCEDAWCEECEPWDDDEGFGGAADLWGAT